MQENLSRQPTLVIISDTAMCRTEDGITVFEPALREIEQISELFHSIHWVGFDYGKSPLGNMRASHHNKITFQLLKRYGGRGIWQKLKVVMNLPYYIYKVNRAIGGANVIHTRAPSLPALIAMVRSLYDEHRIYWHKYAGNWIEISPPFSYGLQRWLLKKIEKQL